MQVVMLASLLAAAAPSATYYVRPDGGDAAQCDGLHDAPYASAAHRACAWNHPFAALPPGGPARIAGGDTLLIGAGSYRMGAGAPDTGALEKCRADWPWDCHAVAIPAGASADRPTRILGAGFDSGCHAPPQLWGTQRASRVLDLAGSDNVEIACLEITDHSSCIEFHNAAEQTVRCERDHGPYGDWAAVGIDAAHAVHVRLADLNIHGLAHDGVRAGGLRDWTIERVRIVGNGWSGWNGDIGAGSSNRGELVFRDVEIAWNGCGERYPGGARFGCWGQQGGGYGDGLGTGESSGHWLFERVHVHHNSQDGIDLLHADASATLVLRDSVVEDNAGNQVKASCAARIERSTVLGRCSALGSAGLDAADRCRAFGNSISLHLPANARVDISGNRIEGEGDCLIDLQCAAGTCAGGSVSIVDNRMRGALRTDSAEARSPCSLWVAPEWSGSEVRFSNNELHALRTAGCPKRTGTCTGNRED